MIFSSTDETLMFCQSDHAVSPKASLLLVHGLGEHSGRYDTFVDYCLRNGISVHRLDLRGHGRSGGTRGHVEAFHQYYDDIEAWLQHLVSSGAYREGLAHFLFGHSLGGLIATGFCARRTNILGHRIDGLILSAPAFGMSASPISMAKKWVSENIPAFLRMVHLPSGIDPSFISRKIDVVAAYRDDPLVHSWVTPAFAKAYFSEIAQVPKYVVQLTAPTLVLVAGAEKIVSNSEIAATVSLIKQQNPQVHLTVKNFPGSYHEIFNDNSQQKAFQQMEDWINTCLRSRQTPSVHLKSNKSSSKSSKPKVTGKVTLL